MASDNILPEPTRGLLGLRPPAELAEQSAAGRKTAATLDAGSLPDRPDYNIISSGRDSEEDGSRGKNSDSLTAIGAGAMLVAFLVVVGLLLN